MKRVWFSLLIAASLASATIVSRQTVCGREMLIEAVTEPVIFGEGPHWSTTQQCLYFVDIDSGLVLKYNDTNGAFSRITVPPGGNRVSFAIPTQEDDSSLVVSREGDLLVLHVDAETNIATVTRTLGSVEEDKPYNRFNEGRADARGRLFAGTVGPEGPNGEIPTGGLGSFYRLDSDSQFRVVETGVDISNGLAWSLDNTKLYYIDTGTNRVDVFDFDIDTGLATNRRPAFDFTQHNVSGVPDSMTIDASGFLWIACYAGSQVIIVDPENDELLGSIQFPVTLVTSAVFGGENLDTLFVTTSRHLLTDDDLLLQPLAGSTFKVTGLQATGLPPYRVELPPVTPK